MRRGKRDVGIGRERERNIKKAEEEWEIRDGVIKMRAGRGNEGVSVQEEAKETFGGDAQTRSGDATLRGEERNTRSRRRRGDQWQV